MTLTDATKIDASDLDILIERAFGNAATNKARYSRFAPARPGIPRHVLEGMIDSIAPGCEATTPEQNAKIHDALTKFFPDREKIGEYRYRLAEKHEQLRLIVHTWVTTDLRESVSGDRTRAVIPLLNIENAKISHQLIDAYDALLAQGMWGIATLDWEEDYEPASDENKGRIRISQFKGLETGGADLEAFVSRRADFSRHQWRHLLCRTLGYNPDVYSDEEQLLLIARLVPIVEPLIAWLEMAAKGIGKSYLYQNFGTRVMLVPGGKISPAVLFLNNRTGEKGLLGRFDTVVLDEIQSAAFDDPSEIIAIMKTYLASGQFSRGGKQTVTSDCGLVLVGNVLLDDSQSLYASHDLLNALPEFFRESAFLDRISGILPSWKLPKITERAVAASVGLKLDYFARIVHSLRYDTKYYAWAEERTEFNSALPKRDQIAVLRIATGMLKLLYPNISDLNPRLYEEDCLRLAVQMRRLVQEQLQQSDAEYRRYPVVSAQLR